MLSLRDLSLEELLVLHRTELHEAFPAAELKPYAAMAHLCRRGAYHPIGAFEGAALVGYAILWSSPDERYVLIDYLGVTKDRRNGGLGGEILRLLAERYAALDGILVESEAPEGGASDAVCQKKPRRVSCPQARNSVESFSPATCASEKILLSPQVCESSAKGGQRVRAGGCIPPSKSSEGVFRQPQSEAPEGGETDALRRRRLGFYQRNGFTFMDYECILFSVHYAVALCSPNGRGTEAAAMAAHQSLYRSQLAPWAYDRFIQIPLDPTRPVAPTESWAGQTTLPGLGEEEERNDRR